MSCVCDQHLTGKVKFFTMKCQMKYHYLFMAVRQDLKLGRVGSVIDAVYLTVADLLVTDSNPNYT
jgi:hypothetical protein